MDWQLAITRNRDALLVIIIALMKSLGLVAGGSLTTLPRALYDKALLIIRPAESAVRRLIMLAAHEAQARGVKLLALRNRTPKPFQRQAKRSEPAPSFTLIEPLKTFEPDTRNFAEFRQILLAHDHESTPQRIHAHALARRILALKNALESIERQARRLTRWYAARDLALAAKTPHRLSPLRPGPPPGLRRRGSHPIEIILRECHLLAIHARDLLDST